MYLCFEKIWRNFENFIENFERFKEHFESFRKFLIKFLMTKENSAYNKF